MDHRERKAQRLHLANEISEKMTAARRTIPPADADAPGWVSVVDMDTNKPVWVPKSLHDEFQRLRFTDDGTP